MDLLKAIASEACFKHRNSVMPATPLRLTVGGVTGGAGVTRTGSPSGTAGQEGVIMITIMLVGALLVGCLGVLVGSTWTTQALEGHFRHHAAERRRLNDEWSALGAVRDQHRWCPRCDGALRREPALVGGPEDQDD